MLRDLDFARYPKVYLVCGYTDLRRGANGLMNLIQYQLGMNPYDKQAIFLFCGRKASTIKGFVWEGDGPLVLTKRTLRGRYQWPRTPDEVKGLSREQFQHLMEGLAIEGTVRDVRIGAA